MLIAGGSIEQIQHCFMLVFGHFLDSQTLSSRSLFFVLHGHEDPIRALLVVKVVGAFRSLFRIQGAEKRVGCVGSSGTGCPMRRQKPLIWSVSWFRSPPSPLR